MQAATLVPVEEYLRTNYDPDRDYVDGRIVERNLGEKSHSRIQGEIFFYLRSRAKELGIQVLPEQRVQVSPTRFRVPDVIVLKLPQPDEAVVSSPPFICIEILSPDDSMEDMQERIEDCLRFGVPHVWIISPRHRKAYVASSSGIAEAAGALGTKDPQIDVPISALFE